MSTVVGVATGMFTLRDQVFPREEGTAHGLSVTDYRTRVGDICDQVNADERARAADDRRLRKRLQTAITVSDQRDALLYAMRRVWGRSSHNQSRFSSLDAPTNLARKQRSTAESWERNLNRILDIMADIDAATNRKALEAAAWRLSRLRLKMAPDARLIYRGLLNLGGDSCNVDPPIVTQIVSLPDRRGPSLNPPSSLNPVVNSPQSRPVVPGEVTKPQGGYAKGGASQSGPSD